MKPSRRIDAAIILVLLLLPLLWFAPQAIGGKTLLPADNLFSFEPWKSYAAAFNVSVPHNALISDLVLESIHWKSFILENLRAGDPGGALWSPRLFAGSPFLAAGQSSALYPLSVIFYILPLWQAYGVFTWLQLGIAAAAMYIFARVLGLRRIAAIVSAIIFAFSGFFIVSVNFTMIIAGAAWLPLLLALIETIVKKQEAQGVGPYSPIPYVVLGALVLAVQIYAGHVEITYYVLMVSAFYAAWRLAGLWLRLKTWRPSLKLAGWLVVMIAFGLALGGAQLAPLYELVSQSFREGSASLQQVRDWAWPSRQIVTFLLPDAFGNPTHHAYLDIWRRVWVPVTQNALGGPLNTIDWGVKNYVEGGNYLGLGALLLALLAAVTFLQRKATTGRQHVALFATLAVLSLLFAFGTPLYAVLYYGLPGYSQLHSAFRWVFPYTLSVAALAGFGLHALLGGEPIAKRVARWLGILTLMAGGGALAIVAVSVFAPGPFVATGERLLAASDLARERAFADGAMAWSYEALRIAQFGLMAVLTGAALTLTTKAQRPRSDTKDTRVSLGASLWSWCLRGAVPLIILADLWVFGHAFNPAVDRRLLEFTPPVVKWLQEQRDEAQPWRITSFDGADEKLLNANSVMRYGIEDVRGYDSIIPKQYVAYMQRIQPQWDLLYNRIGPIYTQLGDQPNYGALDNPLLDLLGVRYVVSTHTIPNAGYALIHEDAIKVYENADAFPRAFIVGEAVAAGNQEEALDRALQADLRNVVVLEGLATVPPPASPQVREAQISVRKNREIFVDVNLSDRGWLVYTDNFFDGWKAYLRPFGVEGEGVDAAGNSIETQLPIYRANGTFRAVYIPQAGQWTVRFVYSPRSILLGVYATFLSGITLLLLAGWWAWGRFYKGEGSEVGTVAKNSVVQVVMSLMSRGIDFAFAMLRLRILSPAGEGSYAFAINFYSIFEILTRFGLGTLVTRDVALDRTRARRYLANVIALRAGLWAASVPLMALVAAFYRVFLNQLTTAELQAIAIFAVALFFQNIADAVTSVFNAFEKMEYPAGTSTAVAVGKVALGALVLLPPLDMGFVGLAGVSLIMNLAQVVWLWFLLERKVLGPQDRARGDAATKPARGVLSRDLQRHMIREGTPLMLNHLLASVFWRISQFVLRGLPNGAAALGIFSAGVKYLDGLNIIPAYFTLAIFPLMSRYAAAGKDSLVKAYRLALQLLFIVALPTAVFVSFAATPLIRILGGAAYLPDSAVVLGVMVWSIPIGFINSVTQYVLIAVNQQRYLTRAFLIGVAFTAIANLTLVPRYGPVASAALLIPAELTLFIPFAWAVHRYVAPMPWGALLGRPIIAAVLNIAAVWGLERLGVSLWVALPVGFVTYVAVLTASGAFRGDEFAPIRDRIRPPGRSAPGGE